MDILINNREEVQGNAVMTRKRGYACDDGGGEVARKKSANGRGYGSDER